MLADPTEADSPFPVVGEFLRKAALGLTALLFVARAYYPSEDAEAGTGLVWVFALLGVAGLAIAANLMAGATRFRWSWADPLVLALVLLVAFGAGHAADRRSAITLAWEWGGLGLLYVLARNLPRSRGESAALAAVVVATAVAVAGYGLFQVPVEFPQLRAMYRANPAAMMGRLGIAPGTPAAESFENRLIGSNEPFSTFALPNSLAGFLVGPLVVLLAVAVDNFGRAGRGSRLLGLLLATGPGLALLACLLLTKSRSAWVGLVVGAAVVAWKSRGAVPRRWLVGSGLVGGVALAGLVLAGVATRQLDVQILTEARKSLGYRWEYWQGAWGVITDAPTPFAPVFASNDLLGTGAEDVATRSTRPFWWGVGPGSFAAAYLRHKLPGASEEIQDPHNMFLQVWAEAGVVALLALVGALVVGLAAVLAPGRPKADVIEDLDAPAEGTGTGWIWVMGGLGWFGVCVVGQLNPIAQDDQARRWLVLGACWLAASLLIAPIWSRRALPAAGLGAAVIALVVNLLAAGGIGIPSVAMGLWVLLALGLNLRDDRPSGRLRTAPGVGPGVALACGWAVLVGTISGAVVPGWRSDLALAQGEAAMAARPPRFDVARRAFAEAIELDRYSTRPWLALADLEYRFWQSPEAVDKKKPVWNRVLIALDKALEDGYRDSGNLGIRRRQAMYARQILDRLPADAQPFELLELRSTIARATRRAVRLYPTSAPLRVELAQANADLGMYKDAAGEARVALQLDDLMPHRDKKLPAATRDRLLRQASAWDEQAKVPAPTKFGR